MPLQLGGVVGWTRVRHFALDFALLAGAYPSTVHCPSTLTTFWSCQRKFMSILAAILLGSKQLSIWRIGSIAGCEDTSSFYILCFFHPLRQCDLDTLRQGLLHL